MVVGWQSPAEHRDRTELAESFAAAVRPAAANHFSEALLATSAHLAISLARKAASFSGEPPM